MSVNIACSTLGCTNSVIGQCTGYKKACGRYYCHEHSSSTLCGDCAKQKMADEYAELEQRQAELVYQEYLALAEKVNRETIPFSQDFKLKNKNLMKKGIGVVLIGVVLFVVMGMTTESNSINDSNKAIIGVLGLTGLGLIVLPFIIVPLQTNANMVEWNRNVKQKRISKKISEIEKEKPGFTQFWNTWKKQRQNEQAAMNRQALMGVLAVDGVIAAVAIGTAASGESDYDRTRRAVRDEMNR
jgi:hypothetical protein